MNLAHVGDRFRCASHVGFRDDFDQRRSRAVQIDAGGVGENVVNGFTRVFFQMRAGDAHAFFLAAIELNDDLTLFDDGQLVLADLIALGQVRIEVVLSREHRPRRHPGADGEPELDRHAHRLGVEHRQHAGQTEVHGARLRIGSCSVSG